MPRLRFLVGPVCVVYLLLSIQAVGCASRDRSFDHGHHHHGVPAHSSLCAWACHAATDFTADTAPHFDRPLPLSSPVAPLDSSLVGFGFISFRRSRAPPR